MDTEPVANQQQLHGLFAEAMNVLKAELDVKTADNQAKYTDVCEWMAEKLCSDGERLAHQRHIEELLACCEAVAGTGASSSPQSSVQSSVQSTVPSPTEFQEGKMLKRFHLRIWQLGGHEASHVKGAPQLHGVRDNMQKFMTGMGCETHKFPLEILFDWPTAWKPSGASPVPGSPVEPFSLGVSIGSTVTMACHLLVYAAMKLDWLNSPAVPDHVKKDVAVRLMSCICNWDVMETVTG